MDYKEKIISLLNSQELSKEQKEKLELIFPELAESEDERIRKGIISAIKEDWPGHADWIAWLEKQCEKKPVELKTKAGNWYVCDMEVMNENMATAFHRDEIYYCPKDGYLDVSGALFEVGSLDVFRLATDKEIPQSHWRPSDEQMKILNEVLNFAANHESPHWNDYIFGTLNNLIRQLKKLREE